MHKSIKSESEFQFLMIGYCILLFGVKNSLKPVKGAFFDENFNYDSITYLNVPKLSIQSYQFFHCQIKFQIVFV